MSECGLKNKSNYVTKMFLFFLKVIQLKSHPAPQKRILKLDTQQTSEWNPLESMYEQKIGSGFKA